MKNRHEILVSFRMRELKMKEMIKDFLDELSSSSPTPGGGGASGLVGAIGCALGLMVGNLTVGKKKYKDVEDEIREIIEKLEDLKKKLVTSVDDDAENFKPLAEAYRLPKNTEEEKKHKEDKIPSRFILTGAGWGHGVGLCQIGAAVMGEQGYKYEEILSHYYPGSTLEKQYQ